MFALWHKDRSLGPESSEDGGGVRQITYSKIMSSLLFLFFFLVFQLAFFFVCFFRLDFSAWFFVFFWERGGEFFNFCFLWLYFLDFSIL